MDDLLPLFRCCSDTHEAHDFFDRTLEEQKVVLIDAATVRHSEGDRIRAHCNPTTPNLV